MLLQEATANTDGYMIAGYAVAFIVMALYVASIYIRNRNLNRDLSTLEELDRSTAQAQVSQPKPKSKKTAKPVTKKARK
jgi:hypothetical protein